MKLRTIAMGMGGILLAASCTNDVVEEVNIAVRFPSPRE